MSTTTTTRPSRARTAAHRVRKTHKTLKGLIPVITAVVGLLGAGALALDEITGAKDDRATKRRRHHPEARFIDSDTGKSMFIDLDDEDDDEDDDGVDDEEEEERSYSPLAHAVTLLHFLLKAGAVLAFVALVGYLVYAGGPTVAAVVLTALILGVIWLSAVVSRRA